jgi:PAS domain S-box-containing protein
MDYIVIAGAVFLLFGIVFGARKVTAQKNELRFQLDAAEKKLQEFEDIEESGLSGRVAELAGVMLKNVGYKIDLRIKDEQGEKIQQTNDFLNNILNSPTNISIVSTDLDRRVIFWNKGAERMLGYTAEEMVGKKNIEIIYANDKTKKIINQHIESVVKKGTELNTEVEEKTKTGETIWVNLAISPRYDRNRKLIGLMGIGENITERKSMQVQLNHAQRMESVGQMAAGIAHEINTPLQFIGDNARFLKD